MVIRTETISATTGQTVAQPVSYVDWAALLAGAVVASAIGLLFSGFGAMSANGEQFGFYSDVEWNIFGSAVPRIWLYQANGGPAQDMSSRGDSNPYALVWQYVSTFRKASGVLTMETPTWVGGNFRL